MYREASLVAGNVLLAWLLHPTILLLRHTYNWPIMSVKLCSSKKGGGREAASGSSKRQQQQQQQKQQGVAQHLLSTTEVINKLWHV